MKMRDFERLYNAKINQLSRVKPIIVKRRSAFTVYEWMELSRLLNIKE